MFVPSYSGFPFVAIVGRPNVGKSTLFNRLAKKRRALVDDMPGVTRDRNYAWVNLGGKNFVLIDTGGFEPDSKDDLASLVRRQVQLAIEEADLIIFMTDGREGIVGTDRDIAGILRRRGCKVIHVVNKIDGPRHEIGAMDAFELGFENVLLISAKHGYEVERLESVLLNSLPDAKKEEAEEPADVIRVSVVGRPNVGKSSIINRLLGEERVIVSPTPGTTTDSIDTRIARNGKDYLFVDTAGIKRKSRISLRVEAYSIVDALRSIERSHVVLLVIDASEGVTDQDAKIAAYAQGRYRAAVILLNKWDLVPKDSRIFKKYVEILRVRMPHLTYAPVLSVSALTGLRMDKVFKQIDFVMGQFRTRVNTGMLNRAAEDWFKKHPPGYYRGNPVRIYYITQIGIEPPTFVLFSNYPEGIDRSYQRYIVNRIRQDVGLQNAPVRLVIRKKKG